ncbi:hypothetical protein FRB99_004891 [Tulasnella sp. 403]|nr:hypothetical protein FRB99_004891 [Tulasnella sp. 403]
MAANPSFCLARAFASPSRTVCRSTLSLPKIALRRALATEARLPPSTPTSTAPTSVQSAIDLVRSQPSHYVVASLVGRKYLLTPRDVLTVPRLNDVKLGDVIALTDIHELGSREYTLRGEPLLPAGTVSVKATVVEHTKGEMEFIVKKKRRKGYKKTIQHKQTVNI